MIKTEKHIVYVCDRYESYNGESKLSKQYSKGEQNESKTWICCLGIFTRTKITLKRNSNVGTSFTYIYACVCSYAYTNAIYPMPVPSSLTFFVI